MDYYFQRYGDLELQRRMVSDRWRTDAFAQAIQEVITPSDVVLDIGTGTGILAMLSARAGARRVYAIDQSEIVQAAANLVTANRLSKVVRILSGPAAELVLEEKATIVISEWLGHLAFVEGMLEDVLIARDRNLDREGRMMPARVEVLIAPVDDPVLFGHDGPGFWRERIHGLDFSMLEELELKQGKVTQLRVESSALLADGQPIVELDLKHGRFEDVWQSGRLTFEVRRDGVLSGFVGWFAAHLTDKVILDTGPRSPETHWSHSYFAFAPRRLRRGTKLSVGYSLERHPTERRHVRLELQVGRTRQEYSVE